MSDREIEVKECALSTQLLAAHGLYLNLLSEGQNKVFGFISVAPNKGGDPILPRLS